MNSFKFFIYLLSATFIISCNSADKQNSMPSNEELDELIKDSYALSNELDFEGAFDKLNQLHKLSIEYDSKNYEILADLNFGRLYSVFNEKDQSLKYFLNAQKISEEYKIDNYLNAIYNNLGIIYSENHFYNQAEEYFKKALLISKEKGITEKIALNLINIAIIKEEINQLDSALYYSNQSLTIVVLNDIENLSSNIYNNIGEILFKEKKYEEAKSKFKRAIELEYPNPDLANIGVFELNLGKTFVLLNTYDSANAHLNNALLYLFKSNNSTLISECYYWLYNNEKSIRNSKKEQDYFDNCLAWKDSVLFQNKEQWLADVKMKYEFGKKESEILFLEERTAIQNKIIVGGAVISFMFLLFSISIWRTRNKNLSQRNIILNKEKELAKVEVERNEALRQKLEEDIENQKQLNKIKHEKIKLDLEHKNKEVVSKAIHLMNKNEILSSLYDLAKHLEIDPDDKNSEIVSSMLTSIKNNLNQDSAWEDFKLHFEEVHESFVKALNQNHPDLSPTDIRLCAYLLIGLHPKEIASVSNISPESVRKRKQRLRSKLNLDSSIEIEDYLKSL